MITTALPTLRKDLPIGSIHPKETPEILSVGLDSMKQELGKRSNRAECKAFNAAPDDLKSPEKHWVMFLRCEVYDAVLATDRMLRYWRRRVKYFGRDKAYLPLTREGALAGDDIALNNKFLTFLPGLVDSDGIGVLFGDPSFLRPGTYSRKSMVRSVWYIIENITLADAEVQRRGVLFLGYLKNIGMQNMDNTMFKMHMDAIKGCLPIRIRKFIVTHPPPIFELIFPVVQIFMPAWVKKRISIYSGTSEEVLEKLVTEYSLNAELLPPVFSLSPE